MIRCLVTGRLHDMPQARTSQSGNTFVTGKLRADGKDGAWLWVSVIAFGQEAERLLTLKQGDAVAIGGRAEIGAWSDKDGNPHIGSPGARRKWGRRGHRFRCLQRYLCA